MDVLFAPDWRSGVPYQRLLAEALQRYGVHVHFLRDYRRIFPLTRLLSDKQMDIFHLHWPEAYYPVRKDGWDLFRNTRFQFDLTMATRNRILVTTAHNLVAHNRGSELFAQRNMSVAFNLSQAIIAHSSAAKLRLSKNYNIPREKIHVIPHGDLSVAYGSMIPRVEARNRLKLHAEKLVLMFGTVEPYKGIEEAIRWWRSANPDVTLAIVGRPNKKEYAERIIQLASDAANVICHLQWVHENEIHLWLSAADTVLFNYRQILTSGAACLARSLGIPIILPHRLDTLDLGEPSPYVLRFSEFDVDFKEHLQAALLLGPCFETASSWRESCRWDRIAALTVDCYVAARQMAYQNKKHLLRRTTDAIFN